MLVASMFRHGGFYPTDAFGIAAVAVVLVVVSLFQTRDRSSGVVALFVGALTLWWFARSVAAHRPVAFLPIGASLLGFLAGFVVVKALGARDRTRVAVTVLAIGALTAALGLVGVLGHFGPLAEHSGAYWQLASPLTHPDAAAAVCALALLVGMALDLGAPLVRLALCLTLAGLVATQTHWSLLVLGAGVAFVPVRRWLEAVWPLAAGTLTAAATIATASGHLARWQGVLAVVALAGSAVLPVDRRLARVGAPASVVALSAVALCVAVLMVGPPGVSGPRPVADQSQTLAWSVGAHAWNSSVVTGVGPIAVTSSAQPVDTYPDLRPDTYLTITAHGGLVGILLLGLAGGAVVGACRRRDVLSSCAAGAGTAFVVVGVVGVGWQLPAVALLGGCVAGLAGVATDRTTASSDTSASESPIASAAQVRRHEISVLALGVCALAALVAVQLAVGFGEQAGGGLPHQPGAAAPPTKTPEAPARTILAGPDVTDPFMLTWHGRDYIYTSQGTSFLNVPVRVGQPDRWGSPSDALPHLPAWAEPGATWAPDVHQVVGGWALYFTALLRGVSPYTHCIGAAFSRSPTGPFLPEPQPFICQLDHRGSIDARVVVEGTRLVVLWKSEDNANPSVPGPDQDGPTGIYAQGLSPDGRVLLGSSVKILGPSEPWESTIVEAPDMVEAWGTYWLFFSGNWYYSASYGIGVAACQTPFGPCSDLSPKPFIGSNLQGQGPGEESLFEDASGVYVLYNPFRANDPGPVIPRPAVMARLGFTAEGPYLATP
jgi:hypothetical protein